MRIHALTTASGIWAEGTAGGINGVFNSADQGGSSWNKQVQTSGSNAAAGPNWAGSNGASTEGVDFVSPALGTLAYNSGPDFDAGDQVDLVLNNAAGATALINSWLDGTNEGLLRSNTQTVATSGLTDGQSQLIRFHSSNFATTASLRPQLIVDFTPVPEPTSVALLGVGGLALLRRRGR